MSNFTNRIPALFKSQFSKTLLAATASALLSATALPPYRFSWIAFLSFIPLYLRLLANPRGWWFAGWWYNVVFNLLAVHWVSANSGTSDEMAFLSYIAMVLYLSFRNSIFFWLAGFIAKRLTTIWGIIVVTIGFAGFEWLVSYGELGFPWTITALPMIPLDAPLFFVTIGGVWLLGTYLLCVNGLLAYSITKKNWRILLAVAVLIIAPYFVHRSTPPHDFLLRVGVIQTSIDPESKWANDPFYTVDRAISLSRELLPQKPDFIVWPETAVPFYLHARIGHRERLQNLIDTLDIPVIAGAQHYLRYGEKILTYNAVFVLKPRRLGGIDSTFYAKRWLVPLGERIPFQWLIPSLHNVNLGQAEFTPGPRELPLEIPTQHGTIKVGTPVCYESIFPQMGAMFADGSVQLLANVTNDAWYDHTNEKPQHASLFLPRAVEINVPLIRSANTGVSGWIDAAGRWQDQMPGMSPMAKVYSIPIAREPVRRIGSYPWWGVVSLISFVSEFIYAFLFRRKQGSQ